MVGVGANVMRRGPRTLCVTSPPPQVGARLLRFYHDWASVLENWFVLEVIRVGASLVFPFNLRCQIRAFPFRSLPRAV